MADTNDIDMLLRLAHMHPADRAVLVAQRAAAVAADQAPVIAPGAPMVTGAPSAMETAIRTKSKAAQDAKFKQLMQQRGAAAAAPPTDAPVIRGNAADLIQ